MSQENVDFVLEFIQPAPEVDFGPLFRDDQAWAGLLAAATPLYRPDCTFLVRGLPGGDRTYVGLDGLRAVWLDWLTPWATYRAEVLRAVDLGDRVLLLYRSFGRPEGSAVEIVDELASIWTVRNRTIEQAEFWATSHAEALEALGLEMPRGKVEIVRATFDAFQRGDQAAMFANIAPDVVVTQFPDQLDVRDFHGHKGVREVMTDWIGTWEDWTIELLAAREIEDHVVASARQRGRGRESGVPIDSEVAFVFGFRGGAIRRWRMFRSEQEALAAVWDED